MNVVFLYLPLTLRLHTFEERSTQYRQKNELKEIDVAISQGTHCNLKRQYTIYWGLIDVRVLPTAPNRQEQFDGAIIHALLPLSASHEHSPFGYARQRAIELLKVELPTYGYELKYLDEFKHFEDVQWQAEEDLKFYRALASQTHATKKLQIGRIYFYSSLDAEDED